jgi:hypothetical protein
VLGNLLLPFGLTWRSVRSLRCLPFAGKNQGESFDTKYHWIGLSRPHGLSNVGIRYRVVIWTFAWDAGSANMLVFTYATA